MNVQAAIDALTYPPTHTYEVASLTPRGVLADRVDIILGLVPDFFRAQRFLDVGASKGFFSLRASRESGEVLAVDPDGVALDAWSSVRPKHVTTMRGTFRDLDPAKHGQFDMIWMGNGHHYAHREDRHGWLDRLASLASDRVVIEGPNGRTCRDVRDWESVISSADLAKEMSARGFVLFRAAPSPPYTPDRSVWHFQRQFRRQPRKVRRD